MSQNIFFIKEIIEGDNSVLFQTKDQIIFYEKLSNTIHTGNKSELQNLQQKAESLDYHPCFESETLKKGKNGRLESLILNVTERCNLSCSYCIYSGNYENERVERRLDMDFGTVRKAIDLFIPQSKDPALISFYGGEPLCNINLIREIIDYVKNIYSKKQVVFSMTTNFSEVSKDSIAEIIGNEIYLNVSLDGPKYIHDKNRRFKDGRPTYDKIMENLGMLERMSSEYMATHVSQNVTCKNSNDLAKIIKFFQANSQFAISRISGIETKGLKRDIRRKQDYSGTFDLALEYSTFVLSEKDPGILRKLFDRDLKNIATRDSRIMPSKLMLDGCCYPGHKKLFVDTDGTFYICERFGRRLAIGDIKRGIDQDSIDKSVDRFIKIRTSLCTNCWAQRLCKPCIQSSKDPEGDISEEGLAQVCDLNKSQILMGLSIYLSLVNKNIEMLKNYIDSIKVG